MTTDVDTTQTTIRPGQAWLHTNGHRIQARGGGSIITGPDGLFYWYGENKISSVLKHPGKTDLYIAPADRWIPQLPESVNVFDTVAALQSGAASPPRDVHSGLDEWRIGDFS